MIKSTLTQEFIEQSVFRFNENTSNGLDTYMRADVHSGHAIQTGPISHGESSTITKNITLYSDSVLTFSWRVSSEENKDLFKFERRV